MPGHDSGDGAVVAGVGDELPEPLPQRLQGPGLLQVEHLWGGTMGRGGHLPQKMLLRLCPSGVIWRRRGSGSIVQTVGMERWSIFAYRTSSAILSVNLFRRRKN